MQGLVPGMSMASNNNFFKSSGRDGCRKSSLAASLLPPLKTLAYGVPPHTFMDYFRMSDAQGVSQGI
jgi:hypothetical protein